MAHRLIGQDLMGFARRDRSRSSLDELSELIDWQPVAALLAALYPATKGEPAWPPLAMFKALLLSVWYDLSDVKLAEALGCVGLRCEREEDVVDVINQARAINDRPVVIDFIVGADAQVWPMVAAGTSNDEIQAAKGIRPLFDDPEEGHA